MKYASKLIPALFLTTLAFSLQLSTSSISNLGEKETYLAGCCSKRGSKPTATPAAAPKPEKSKKHKV